MKRMWPQQNQRAGCRAAKRAALHRRRRLSWSELGMDLL
jgi:hypothetical protein